MKYGQFCPVAKAAEVLGERWMLLVLRELLAGASSYKELERALGRISPSVLSDRLRTLVEHGIVERIEAGAGKRSSYRLTAAGAELAPVIAGIAGWGQRWVRSRMTRDELDVELLMLHLARQFDAAAFPQKHAVLGFVFSDLRGAERRWWLLLDAGEAELCVASPGRPEDVTLTCTLRSLSGVFNGDTTLTAAMAAGLVAARGPRKLVNNLHRWLKPSPFASPPRLAARAR